MTDFASGTAFGSILGASTSWDTARSTSAAIEANVSIGLTMVASTHYPFRSFLQFDTSEIPDAATITQVNLRMVCITDSSGVDFDIQIVKQNWTSPLAAGNREANYDGCLAGTADDSIWRNTNGMSVNTQYTSGNLDPTWVNKTGITYYSLRSSFDFGNSDPGATARVYLGTPTDATVGYRPVLIVTYATGCPVQSMYYMKQRGK
jgi:hypothetical protein